MTPRTMTRRMYKNDPERTSTCEVCGREAHYWTQVENGEKPASRVVYHCQAHRAEGRELAEIDQMFKSIRTGSVVTVRLGRGYRAGLALWYCENNGSPFWMVLFGDRESMPVYAFDVVRVRV